jgi:hypothetical protein
LKMLNREIILLQREALLLTRNAFLAARNTLVSRTQRHHRVKYSWLCPSCRHDQSSPKSCSKEARYVSNHAMLKPLQSRKFLRFGACCRRSLNWCGLRFQGVVSFGVAIASATPDAVAIACSACTSTSSTNRLQLIAFDFTGPSKCQCSKHQRLACIV